MSGREAIQVIFCTSTLSLMSGAACVGLLSSNPVWAGTKEQQTTIKVQQTNYNYTAFTEKTAGKQGTVKAGSLSWQCSGNRCTIRGPWPTPGVSACQSLAEQVGRIQSYGHPGKKLTSAQLAECNKGVGMASVTSMEQKISVLDTGKPPPAVVLGPETGDPGKISRSVLPTSKERLGDPVLPRPQSSQDGSLGGGMLRVTSPKASVGGSPAEEDEEAEIRRPQSLRHRDRQVGVAGMKSGLPQSEILSGARMRDDIKPLTPEGTAGRTGGDGRAAPPAPQLPAASFGKKATQMKMASGAVRGPSADSDTFRRMGVRTNPLRLTGRGRDGEVEVAAAAAVFTPVATRTGLLKLTGRGREGVAEVAAAAAAFTPVVARTGPLRLTGRSRK